MTKIVLKNIFLFITLSLSSCTSQVPRNSNEEQSASAREHCLMKEQNEKKAIYEALPELLKKVSGNSQKIAEWTNGSLPLNPTKKDIEKAISLVPEMKDAGMWGTEKEGRAYTVSGTVLSPSELSHPKSGKNISLFTFTVGQPGRIYQMPVDSFRPQGDTLVANVNETYVLTPSVGLPVDLKPYNVKVKAQMRIRPIDQRHFLILVNDQSPKDEGLNFTPKYSLLIRTYPPQEFNIDDHWHDWPVYGVGDGHSPCDSIDETK